MMKDKKALTIIGILVAAVIIAAVIMLVGSMRAPFSGKTERRIVTASLEGQASVIRRGTGYNLKEGIGIIETDTLVIAQEGEAAFKAGDICGFSMDGNSQVDILTDDEDLLCISADRGTVLFDKYQGGGVLNVSIPSGTIVCEEAALFSVECYTGTQTVNVYKGSITVSSESVESARLSAGDRFSVVQDEDGNDLLSRKEDLTIYALNSFLLRRLSSSEGPEIFTEEELSAEAERRISAMEKALADKAAYDREIIAKGGEVTVIEPTKELGKYMTLDDIHSCTLSIVCHTILDNAEDLDPDSQAYVPENGVIMAPTTVQYVVGENVFDVLKRACFYADIPIEYDWANKFGGYYIKSIRGISEFDCGPESGWMYKVNDWFPNHGCSSYVLREGDVVVWEYTCEGLGADIGCYWGL